MKKEDEKPHFQTHIAEPRWQQIVSVVGVVIIAIVWLLFVFHHKAK